MEDGKFLFSDVLTANDYSLSVVTPLGYRSTVPVEFDVLSDVVLPDVTLSCIDVIEEARGTGCPRDRQRAVPVPRSDCRHAGQRNSRAGHLTSV